MLVATTERSGESGNQMPTVLLLSELTVGLLLVPNVSRGAGVCFVCIQHGQKSAHVNRPKFPPRAVLGQNDGI